MTYTTCLHEGKAYDLGDLFSLADSGATLTVIPILHNCVLLLWLHLAMTKPSCNLNSFVKLDVWNSLFYNRLRLKHSAQKSLDFEGAVNSTHPEPKDGSSRRMSPSEHDTQALQ